MWSLEGLNWSLKEILAVDRDDLNNWSSQSNIGQTAVLLKKGVGEWAGLWTKRNTKQLS